MSVVHLRVSVVYYFIDDFFLTGSIESLPVMFEGQEYTLQDLAQISRKGPKLVVLNMALFPQTIPTVIDVINKSGMNLNPQQDSTSIYIEIPK